MQQHTFGIRQGSARSGRGRRQTEASIKFSTTPQQRVPVVCGSSKAADSSFRGRRRCGGETLGWPCPAGLSRWDGQARHVSTSPFSRPQKVPARK